MTSTPDNADQHIQADHNESLAERSARLEAEAALGNMGGNIGEIPAQDDTPETGNAGMSNDVLALQTELAEAKDQLLRAVAETENTRRRAQKDREDASKFAVSRFARDIVGIADNLRRALDAVPEDLQGDERITGLTEGIEATERELLRSFERNGIQKIDPVGEIFNPNFHEVMFEAPADGQPAGTIIQVMETGYILNGRLLRPARVGVIKDEGQGGAPAGSGGTIDTKA